MKSKLTNFFKNPILRQPRANFGLLAMIGSVVFFTTNTLILKWLVTARSLSPSVPLLFRAVVGATIVFMIFLPKRQLEIRKVFLDKTLAWRGITGIIGTAAYYYTVPTLGAGKSTLLCNTYVVFAAIIAAIFLKEALRLSQAIWLILSFVGIALLLGVGQSLLQVSSGLYELIGLIGALAAATTVVLIRQLTQRYSNGTIFLAQCLWVGLPILPFALPHLIELNSLDICLLVLCGSMAASGQLLLNEGFRRLPVATGASIQNTWPLMTTIGGVFLFGEQFTLLQWLGGCLILLGTFMISVRKNS